jgi:hypothetical protein
MRGPLRLEKKQARRLGPLQRTMHLGHRQPGECGQLGVGRALVATGGQGQQEVKILRLEHGLTVGEPGHGLSRKWLFRVSRNTKLLYLQCLVNNQEHPFYFVSIMCSGIHKVGAGGALRTWDSADKTPAQQGGATKPCPRRCGFAGR